MLTCFYDLQRLLGATFSLEEEAKYTEARGGVALLVYIRIRYNTPTRIIYIQTFIRQIKAKQTKVQHLIQEYCTSLKAGILYNRENRNFVQHRKQEYCTSLND